jgi:hypothetical protein
VSERDGTELPHNPGDWDLERLARPDISYIKLVKARMVTLAMDATERLDLEGIKVAEKCLDGIIRADDARRDREDLELLQAAVEELERKVHDFQVAGGQFLGEPPEAKVEH